MKARNPGITNADSLVVNLELFERFIDEQLSGYRGHEMATVPLAKYVEGTCNKLLVRIKKLVEEI